MKTGLQACAGKFITLEGVEGVGKSTQLMLLAESLEDAGVDIVTTREPGGTKIAEEIRAVLLKHHTEVMHSTTELLLLFAARAQHIASVIRPALHADKCVLCDRFTDATYAYQGGGRQINVEQILQLETLVQGNLQPDLTLLLDCTDIDLCLARAKGVGTGDRIETEARAFFERTREAYLQRARTHRQRFALIDAQKSVDEVHAQIMSTIHAKLVNL